ncbi:hypothetical protein ES703_103012 [subsurface metagenome]
MTGFPLRSNTQIYMDFQDVFLVFHLDKDRVGNWLRVTGEFGVPGNQTVSVISCMPKASIQYPGSGIQYQSSLGVEGG